MAIFLTGKFVLAFAKRVSLLYNAQGGFGLGYYILS